MFKNQALCEKYELIKEKHVKELNAEAFVLRHKKSGARLFLVSNDDENKVFTIGFRTPVSDSTGVPHIMEHSVLCGSDKYPVKDPFVELVKGSLNTFLNAMTYNDKTVYPIASCNDQDFKNLMDVYLDAVFHPAIYENEKIFRQEGWHYELEDTAGPLTINGVVYNEMKGVYSSPESVLESCINRALYPDTTYSRESGGDPEEIPALTYEVFLDFHRTHYHPSNSYIYLYGDMDMEERLLYLDREYLSAYRAEKTDTEIGLQKGFSQIREDSCYYPIGEDEEEAGKTYLSWCRTAGDALDPVMTIAFQILEYVLLSAPGAPVKQALIDAGIGTDIYGGYDSGIRQPSFSIIAKNAELSQKEEFLSILEASLKKLAEEGIDPSALAAALNYYEFKYREADFGAYPRGLMYGLNCFDSWLYDETDPFMHLEFEGVFTYLKDHMRDGYFEELIRTWFLQNTHGTLVTLCPKKGLDEEREAILTEKLEKRLEAMSMEEREVLIQATKELKQYQEEPTPREDLLKIPMLTRQDIRREVLPFTCTEKQCDGVPVLHSQLFTNDITYLQVLFRAGDVSPEELCEFKFFESVLGALSTQDHSYQELSNAINSETGGIGVSIGHYLETREEGDISRITLEFSAKVFSDRAERALCYIREIMDRTIYEDDKRLRELAARYRSRLKSKIVSAGHLMATTRAGSYDSETSAYTDRVAGIAYYEFLEDLERNFDERKEALKAKLSAFAERFFVCDRMAIHTTCDEAGYEALTPALRAFIQETKGTPEGRTLRELMVPSGCMKLPLSQKNEGIKASTQVQYVARTGNFRKAGLSYTGALRILQVILSYEYLWVQVRVKGGAYGAMSGFSRGGNGYFVSYRDPNLSATSKIFEGVSDYVAGFEADEREMTKYIIGTISGMDTPMNPRARGGRDLSACLSGLTEEMLQKERDEVLDACPEDIRALSAIAAAITGSGSICVIGGDSKIEQDKELFKEIRRLS